MDTQGSIDRSDDLIEELLKRCTAGVVAVQDAGGAARFYWKPGAPLYRNLGLAGSARGSIRRSPRGASALASSEDFPGGSEGRIPTPSAPNAGFDLAGSELAGTTEVVDYVLTEFPNAVISVEFEGTRGDTVIHTVTGGTEERVSWLVNEGIDQIIQDAGDWSESGLESRFSPPGEDEAPLEIHARDGVFTEDGLQVAMSGDPIEVLGLLEALRFHALRKLSRESKGSASEGMGLG